MKKRLLASLLSLSLLLSLLPSAALAETATDNSQTASGTTVEAEELTGVSRLDQQEVSSASHIDVEPLYADDDMVTVIVQLDAPAVMDYYDMASYAADDGEDDLTAGEAVAEFLGSDAAQAEEEELLDQQEELLSQIQSVPMAAELEDEATSATVEVVAQWTAIVNAMAVKVPYGMLETIQNMDGVQNAYVEITYDRPEEPSTEAGNAGYSYDMVGINEVWSEGYTGKGMLVAVLDTGLDLNWTAYTDNSANLEVTGNSHIASVHEAFTNNSFKSSDAKDHLRYTSDSLAAYLKTTSLNAEHLWVTDDDGNTVPGTEVTYDYNALYKNLKVPFAYDYADCDVNVYPSDSDHGTHVSGTILGYAAESDGAVKFSGIAPDAQLLAMKVFSSSGGATESVILNALEDAAKLGADVVNLSLGSTNGFSQDDTAAVQVYETLNNAGVLFMISAGNEAYSSSYNNYDDDYGLASDPDISMIASPSVYDSVMSVASISSTVDAESRLQWTDVDGTTHEIAYYDPDDVAMKYKFSGEEELSINIIPVEGTGTYSDYYNAGFRSYYGYGEKGVEGIALVKRGDITFTEKVNNASNFTWSYYDSALGRYVTNSPVKAVLIYDNDPESSEMLYIGVENTSLTCASLSGADGKALYDAATAALESGTYVTLTKVNQDDDIVSSDSGYQMSTFSSWGSTPSLELKPDITAPGGNIWSCLVGTSTNADTTTNSYGMMSGTSMAAPHMTGITALVEQYVKTKGYLTKEEDADLTDNLLVSTAVPQKDANGVYYSPRLQGAGLVNAAAAISTPAYISVEGQNVGKLELLDDPNKTGSYTLTFDVNNLTTGTLSYNAKAVVLRPDTTTAEDDSILMTTDEVEIMTVDLGTVTVTGKGTTTVSKTISLSAEQKAVLDSNFENGVYVEGFVILTDASGENPQIGLPFLAFYGDWTAAPILDRVSWVDDVEDILDADYTWGPNILGYYDGYNFANLGQNPFDPSADEEQMNFKQENITLSPGTGYFQEINDFILYQLRDSKVMVAEVRDKETGELYYRDWATYQVRSYYDSSYGYVVPCSALYGFTDTSWGGTDLEGNVLPSGTQCVYTITAYGDGDYPTVYNEEAGRYITDVESIIPGENEPTFNGHAMDTTGDTLSFDVMVDTEAPTLVNNSVSIYEEDGHVYLTGTFQDDGSLASIEVAPVVSRSPKGRPEYTQTTYVQNDDFYVEYIYDADVQEYTFKADVTEYVHKDTTGYDFSMYDYTWTGAVYVFGGDYGGNDRGYAVQVKNGDDFNTENGLVLSQTSALLHPGSEFDLSVVNNTGSDADITRTSSNPEVATVDEFGRVVAVAPGQTTITVSNGTISAVCIVAVEKEITEVLDFNLSVESFDGLKPEGSLVVKVTDLYPADVDLTSIRWEVSEDDETAQYYEGLINCAQYSTDGLQGEIYLNYSAYDQYDEGSEKIPGGSGTLTVTLNGVSRSMKLSWQDLYKTTSDEDLVSDLYGGEQAVFVTQGETATLVAKYNDTSAHAVSDVNLYTAQNYVNYAYDNVTTAATGLVLDGPDYCGISSSWSGKLVNTEGYALPDHIRVFYRYDYGYEYELSNSWRTDYTYDASTGEITVNYTPANETCQLVIRADGVESAGNPAGTLSGVTYVKPDGIYGPFTWTVASGNGELKEFENELNGGYTEKNGAYYTPSEPGASIITATSADGKYSVNFVVVSEAVKADTLTLDNRSLTLEEGQSQKVTGTLTPTPSLEKDKELIWTSFNESVATVDQDGNITAVAPGYAFIKVATKADTTVQSYVLVEVTAKEVEEPDEPSDEPTKDPADDAFDCDGGTNCPSKAFTDVNNSLWYHEAVDYAITNKLMNGYDNGKFGPNDSLTRAQLVQILYNQAGKPAVTGTSTFSDVANGAWYTNAVLWASQNGIVNGYGTTFGPNDKITREQLAVILWRYAGKPAATQTSLNFSDAGKVSSWAKDAMLWATEVGIIQGNENGLNPGGNATRAEAATMVMRYLKLEK